MPFQTNGRAASSTNELTWNDFESVVLESDKIGFCLGGGFVGIDLDDCFDGAELKPWAREIVETLDSYTELSPSGRGVHIIARGELPSGRRKVAGVEMYNSGRYLTVTGNWLRGDKIEERGAEIEKILS